MINGRTPQMEMKRTIYYLGNKFSTSSIIDEICAEKFGKNSSVMDLFSGSGSCTRFFALNRRVISNDIQIYSSVINKALSSKHQVNIGEIRSFGLSSVVSDELSLMKSKFHNVINEEECFLKDKDVSRIENIRRILDDNADFLNNDNYVVLKYGATYFSLQQSCEIQALLNSLKKIDGELHFVAKATVLSAASRICTTVGNQFAQPLKLLDKNHKPKSGAIAKYISQSRKSALSSFHDCADIYTANNLFSSENITLTGTEIEAIKSHASEVDFIYADPPYGREHYSRFYHVLESLATGDYHQIGAGPTRMRAQRFQSSYGIRTQVESAFRNLFLEAQKAGVPMALSYADDSDGVAVANRAMPIKAICAIANEYFDNVETYDVSTRNFSQLNNASNANAERKSRDCLIVMRQSDAEIARYRNIASSR